jgi:ATP synthase subunit 6
MFLIDLNLFNFTVCFTLGVGLFIIFSQYIYFSKISLLLNFLEKVKNNNISENEFKEFIKYIFDPKFSVILEETFQKSDLKFNKLLIETFEKIYSNETPLEAFTTEIWINMINIDYIFPFIYNIQINNFLILISLFLILFYKLFFFYSYNFYFFCNILQKYILLSLFYVDQLNFKMRHYFCSFLSILILIINFNIIGLIPLNMSFTAQLITNLNFTISIIIGLILIGFNLQGISFLQNFIPQNVPIIMVPFLFLIELLSFFMRIFSMSIRLFSNMVAGHSLLHLLNEFTVYIIILSTGSSILLILSFIPLIISYFWLFFELFVAFLQAYVFILLYLLYLADVNKSH